MARALLSLVLAILLATPAWSQTTHILIKNANVFDGVNEKLQEGVDVLIEDNLIKQIAANIDPPDDAEVIDAAGNVLMPGLIDVHWHTSYCCTAQATLVTGDMSEVAIHGFIGAKATLMRGFTSVRDVGGNPFTATAVYALIAQLERAHGVHFAMGGTGVLIKGLAKLIEKQGGSIRLNAPVAQITVENGRATGVELESGEHIPADVVVSNADSAATYKYLLSRTRKKRWTDRRLYRAKYSMSLFVWYFGTNRRYEDVDHHMILLSDRYRELLVDIFDRKILAKDFSLYLHRPTATDPSLAPDGCDAFYVLSPVPNQKSCIDWKEQAEPYRQAISKYLSETVLPDLEDHVVTSRMLTPDDFGDRLSSVNGAAFGLQPILLQTAWFRPHNISEEADGLYLVGAGTHPGAGLPGVVSSAEVLSKLVPDARHAPELKVAAE